MDVQEEEEQKFISDEEDEILPLLFSPEKAWKTDNPVIKWVSFIFILKK